MKKYLLMAIFTTAQASTLPQIEKPPLFLGLGEQRVLTVPGLLKYSLGSKVVRVLPFPAKQPKSSTNETLFIKSVALGNGDLWIWKKDASLEHRQIHVRALSAQDHNPILERALSKLEEVEIFLSPQGVMLRGEIQSLAECAKIAALLHFFPENSTKKTTQVWNETTLSPELLELAHSKLKKWLNQSGYESLQLIQQGGTLWVRGSLAQASEKISLEKHLRALFPLVQTELDTLPDHAMTVYFRIFLFELNRSQFKTFGMRWSTSTAIDVRPNHFKTLGDVQMTLQHLEGKGEAKILSNPELVVLVPGEAELFSGGQLPLRAQSRFYSNVSWKKHGLTLRLKATHTTSEKVRLEIFTELSHLDVPSGSDNLPGILSNEMKTQVDANYGVPLFLSGFLQQTLRENTQGLPLLQQLPVLGPLFGSKDYLSNRSELVAILYPYTAPPPSQHLVRSLQLPRGNPPPPREWLSPAETRALENHPHYPWNVLQ
jgi:hypothetical protein